MNLEILQLVFHIITTTFVVYLTIEAVKFAAKPKLKIRFKDGRKEVEFAARQKATLILHLQNQGRWLAKPAARKLAVFVNFQPIFEPMEIRYGSVLEFSNREVRTGKGGRKYLRTEEVIYLYHEEPGEDLEVDVKMPDIEGRYPIDIPAYSEEGSCGFERLWIKVFK